MTRPSIGVLRVVPERSALSLSHDEADAILEISFLAIAADRKLRDEEIHAFRQVADRLRTLSTGTTAALSDHEMAKILERFSENMDRTVADARLREAASKLGKPEVKKLAYKIAYALALCDLDTSDEEFEFDLELIDALDLSAQDAEDLEGDVLAAFHEN